MVVPLWFDVFAVFTAVEFCSCVSKVLLHEVNVIIIVLHVDTGVLDEDDAEAVEALGDLLALFDGSCRGVLFSTAHIKVKVDNRHCCEIEFVRNRLDFS